MKKISHGTRRVACQRGRSREGGMAMLVIVGILAALFIMGSTFALLMRTERRSSQNLAMNEAARRRAQDRLENAIQLLAASCREYSDSSNSLWYTRSNHDNPQKPDTFHIQDEDSMFNLNAMGFPADLGSEADYRQHFTSFESSLVRVLMAVPGMDTEYPDSEDLRRVCILIAREIAERRYGTPRVLDPVGDPTGLTTIPRPSGTFVLPHLWGWSISTNWIPPAGADSKDDVGVTIYGTSYGARDGYPSMWIRYDGASAITYSAEPNIWWRHVTDPPDPANDDIGTGYPQDTNDAKEIGCDDSLPSAIRVNDPGDPTKAKLLSEAGIREWIALPTNEFWQFDPEAADGDDRAYTSIYEIPAIIQDVLVKYEGMSDSAAWTKAGSIFSRIKPYVCVHSHNRRGQAPGSPLMLDGVSINDWANDRIDNDGDGLVDETAAQDKQGTAEGDEFTPKLLAERLGLLQWADSAPTSNGERTRRRQQVMQLVANIIDSRDDDNAPTEIAPDDFDYDDTALKTAYGCEGLHITEVMAMPDKLVPTKDYLTKPGGGWVWDKAGYYRQNANQKKTGEWEFPGINGWYALRIYSQVKDTQLDFIYPTGAGSKTYTVTTSHGTAAPYYGYVRDSQSKKLVAVQVQSKKLTFDIAATKNMTFTTIQLLPQFVVVTNIAMHAPTRPTSHGIDLNGFILDAGLGAGKEVTLGTARYFGGAGQVSTSEIPAAHADGTFPVDYGLYVVAISEAAYAKQYGGPAGETPAHGNGNDVWGDADGEIYPVFFVGDSGADAAAKDTNANNFAIPKTNLTVTLIRSTDDLMAGGEVDGLAALPSLTDYVSKEKKFVDARSPDDWANDDELKYDLLSSQNRLVKLPASPKHGQEHTDIRSSLNRRYEELYPNGNRDEFKPMDYFVREDVNVTLPIVLNRPYASPAWLGLVPSGTKWRTVDLDPTPDYWPSASGPEELLGLLMQNAITSGYYARININTAPACVLKSAFDDTTADRIIQERAKTRGTPAHTGWQNWDELLSSSLFTDYGNGGTPEVGYFDDTLEDSGAGSYADDFADDRDEKEEWFRRFSGLIDIRSTAFRVTTIGSVDIPGGKAVAEIEAVVDRDRDTNGDGIANCSLAQFRHVTETP